MRNVLYSFIAILTLLLISSCKDSRSVKHYRVVKEERKDIEEFNFLNQGMPSEFSPDLGTVSWAFLPENWVDQGADAVRKGSFILEKENEKIDISITAFPGDVGGVLANINRWAAQIGLGAFDQTILNALEKVDIDGLEGQKILLNGPQKSTIAVIVKRNENSWFFKAMGDKGLVKEQEKNFNDFINNIHFKDE